jgi:hypothetical protein
MQLNFAKVGYAQKVKELGEAIAKAQDMETIQKLTEELTRATEAIKRLDESVKYSLEVYQESAGGKQ